MRYRDQRGEMKYDFVAVHQATHEARIANVAADEICPLPDRLRQIVKPAMAVERIVLGKSRYFGAGGNEGFRQVRTNETVRSRYEDLFANVIRDHDARLIFGFGPAGHKGAVRPVTRRGLPRPPERSSRDRKRVSGANNRRGRFLLSRGTELVDRTLRQQPRPDRACFRS